MLSFSPLSTTPYSSLGGINQLYVSALFESEASMILSPLMEQYASSTLDCFSDLLANLHPIRQINVYHTMYTKTDIDYTMTVDTSEVQILHYLATFDTISYITTDLSLELELTKDIDFIMYARDETLISIDFIMNVVKETL
jgi:hypothetical protein